MRNLITDVPGLGVGNAHDARLASGVTVVLLDDPAAVSGTVLGGAPRLARIGPARAGDAGARRRRAGPLGGLGLRPRRGLRRTGVAARAGARFAVGTPRVPLVGQAIVFDLLTAATRPGAAIPRTASSAMRPPRLPGRISRSDRPAAASAPRPSTSKAGSARRARRRPSGSRVGALAAVNAITSAVVGDGPHFWAAPLEHDAEFGGLGFPERVPPRRGRSSGRDTSRPAPRSRSSPPTPA